MLRNGSPQCLSQLICSWILWNRVILVCQEIVLNLSCPNERVSTNLSATAAVYTAHEETVAVKTAPDFNAAFSVKRKPTYEQAGDMEMTSENDERDYTWMRRWAMGNDASHATHCKTTTLLAPSTSSTSRISSGSVCVHVYTGAVFGNGAHILSAVEWWMSSCTEHSAMLRHSSSLVSSHTNLIAVRQHARPQPKRPSRARSVILASSYDLACPPSVGNHHHI